MSELKAFDVGLGQYCEDGSPCVVAFDADRNPRILSEKVYLKSEADKVIAEKDEKIDELEERIDELQKATDSAWSKVNAMYDELRRSNYNRCLLRSVIAEMNATHFKDLFYGAGSDALADEYNKQITIHYKWQKRWLALAEKFNDGK